MPEPLASALEAAASSTAREQVRGGVGYEPEQSPTLTEDYHNPAIVDGCLTPWDCQSKRIFDEGSVSPTLQAGGQNSSEIQPTVLSFNAAQITSPQNRNNPQPGDACQTLDTDTRAAVVYSLQSDGSTSLNSHGDGFNDDGSAYTLNCIDRQSVVCLQDGQTNGGICDGYAPTLNAMHEQSIVIGRAAFNQGGVRSSHRISSRRT